MSTFDEYVAERGVALLRFAYLLTGDHQLAEDLVQESLVRVHRRWSRIRRTDRPGAYVRQTILRQYLSWRRRSSSSEIPVAVDADRSGDGDPADRVSERAALMAALATLPRQQRAVLVLRFYEDRDDGEIAALLGCTAATVRSHASRGLARLRANAAAEIR
ncbi:SigE family RNA polymerase sigma factor [Cryptosporangium phraense]|uniref:SigE family RNA polymerase sigma factor n=1 Tax=Cryptosporangium phraense TaxID=2593070 RepID=A0A545B0L1_9ACTN|nr:SigE family RNA polymerase sigma factor [Cryptosporangium phraense]